MMSCVQFQICKGWSLRTGILVGGWRRERRLKNILKIPIKIKNKNLTAKSDKQELLRFRITKKL